MSELAGARPRVIYIMGSGHSGSTILGVALGNCEGMFFAGELEAYLFRFGTPVLGGLERTRFWARVRELVPEARELYGNEVHRVLERSSAALRPSAARERRALRERYRRVAEALYGALATVAGASHIVDSSHFPLRARELQAVAGIELQLVFLVRDPQAVVTSITRLGDRHSVLARGAMLLKANANLWITYALSLSVFLRQPRERRIFLRYEDFIADPESALRRIIRASGSAAAVPDLGALRTGLAIHGNRLIESDVVELRRGGPVTSARGSSWLTALLQRPWDALFARLARPR